MATVTGFTADRMKQIEDNVITAADIVDGNLIFIRYDGSQLDAGPIAGSILNPSGVWDVYTGYSKSDMVFHDGSTWLATGTTTPGQEPGVHSIWQEFAVSGYSDVTIGDHNIAGNITFDNFSPIVPPATTNNRAANLGDVKTEIAQEPLLLDSVNDEITYVEASGDIRTVLTGGLTRQKKDVTGVIYFPTANTTTEAVLSSTSFSAGAFANYDKFRYSYSGLIQNNTGIDIDFTFRLKMDGATYPDKTFIEFPFTLPTNSPSGDVFRPFFLSGESVVANLFGAGSRGFYGTNRLIVGDVSTSDGDVFIERIKAPNQAGVFIDMADEEALKLTIQMNVAHDKARVVLNYATVEVLPYVAP